MFCQKPLTQHGIHSALTQHPSVVLARRMEERIAITVRVLKRITSLQAWQVDSAADAAHTQALPLPAEPGTASTEKVSDSRHGRSYDERTDRHFSRRLAPTRPPPSALAPQLSLAPTPVDSRCSPRIQFRIPLPVRK